MDEYRLYAFAALLPVAIAILVSQASTRRQMVDAVNSRLPEPDRFIESRSDWRKTRRLIETYRRLFPEGDLVNRQLRREWSLVVIFVAGAWILGLPWFAIGCGVVSGMVMYWLLYRK